MTNLIHCRIGGAATQIALGGLPATPSAPILDPTEKAFAKLKALFHKLAARTVARLWDALGDLLDASPRKNAPTIASAEYGSLIRDAL
jgi:hypothetical protein